LNPFVASIELERAGHVFGKQHHALIVGNRGGENLPRERRDWYASGVCSPAREIELHRVFDVAVNAIERKSPGTQIFDVAAELNLADAVRAIVQLIAAELPERSDADRSDVDAILQCRAVAAVFRIAATARRAVEANRRECVGPTHRIVGKNAVERERILAEDRQRAVSVRPDAEIADGIVELAGPA